MSEILRVVFDTQIYVRGLTNPNSVTGRLFSVWAAYYALHWTDAIQAEIHDVFSRPKVRAKFPMISENTVQRVREILAKGIRVEVQAADIEPISRDPKDDIFLACAKVANADYLVSEDNDLLVVGQHHSTRIVNVTTFLTVLEQRGASSTPEHE